MLGLPYKAHCQEAFVELGLLTVPNLFIFENIMHNKKNDPQKIKMNQIKTHSYSTRIRSRFAESNKLSIHEKKPQYIGTKMYQALPRSLRSVNGVNLFKNKLKHFFMNHTFYDVDEYWELCSSLKN
jgi:hypothetical protein